MAEITTKDFFPPMKPNRVTGSSDLIALFKQDSVYLNTKQDTMPRALSIKASNKESLSDFLQPTSEGKRDDTLWNIIVRLQGKNSPSEVLAIVRLWNSNNNPPLEDKVLVEKVNRIGNFDIEDTQVFNPGTALKVVSSKELMNKKYEDIEWIIHKWLPVGVTMVVAASKVGKSTFIRDQARAIVQGSTFLGEQAQQCGILYCSLEESERQMAPKMQTLGIAEDDSIYYLFDTNIKDSEPPTEMTADQMLEAIKHYIDEKNIRVVYIDTILDMPRPRNFNLDKYEQVKPWLRNWLKLAKDKNIALCFLHHSNKKGRMSITGEMVSTMGSEAMNAVPDYIVTLFEESDSSTGETEKAITTRGRLDIDVPLSVLELDTESQRLKILGEKRFVDDMDNIELCWTLMQDFVYETHDDYIPQPEFFKLLDEQKDEDGKKVWSNWNAKRKTMLALQSMGRVELRRGARNNVWEYKKLIDRDDFIGSPLPKGETNQPTEFEPITVYTTHNESRTENDLRMEF
jgi:hypothetical protein